MIRSRIEMSDRGAVEKGASIFISCARLIRVVSRIQGVSNARFVPLPSSPFTHSRYFSFLIRGHTYIYVRTHTCRHARTDPSSVKDTHIHMRACVCVCPAHIGREHTRVRDGRMNACTHTYVCVRAVYAAANMIRSCRRCLRNLE